MKLDDFRKAGHWPTLLAAFLYFDVSFMAWVSLGPLMIYIAKDMHLSVEQKLSLVAIPVLGGAFFRLPLGLIADAIGPKITGVIAQVVVLFAVTLVYLFGLSILCRSQSSPFRWASRRLLRRGAAAGEPLVPAAVSRGGDGHRRRRQHGCGAGHPSRAVHCGKMGMADRLWHIDDHDDDGARRVCVRRKRRARHA